MPHRNATAAQLAPVGGQLRIEVCLCRRIEDDGVAVERLKHRVKLVAAPPQLDRRPVRLRVGKRPLEWRRRRRPRQHAHEKRDD
ncbi:MAG TPA: hypothetical protein PLE80_12060, partial [Opitutaceae bacterium]|nr:hypothetical protein [Opitutaceae bacterium]